MTLAIAIAGCNGQMGRALITAAGGDNRFSITGTTTRRGVSASAAGANADVWIDFTTPDATMTALDALGSSSVRAAVIGTTGFSPAQKQWREWPQCAHHRTAAGCKAAVTASVGASGSGINSPPPTRA